MMLFRTKSYLFCLVLSVLTALFSPLAVYSNSEKQYPSFINEAILQLLADLNVFNHCLIDTFEPISHLKKLKVTYASGASTHLGNDINLVDVSSPPISVSIPRPKKSGYYTLLMLDPDIFRRDGVGASLNTPKFNGLKVNNFFHWGIVNIPVKGSKHHNGEQIQIPIHSGTVVAQYFSPMIILDTGMHRYTFLLYRQSEFIDTDNIPIFLFPVPSGHSFLERSSFFVDSYFSAFAHHIKMKLVAMNYFVAQHLLP